ncbi:hypothetical protein [Kluyvera ascorbata]|uniref:hypothetical protein n=1 Tax=Kluyvera ascorbata TaxID=51288 RepID=UPI0034D699B9
MRGFVASGFYKQLKGALLLKYFNADQIFADLVTGRTQRGLIHGSLTQARKKGQTGRVRMFEEALRKYDEWRATPNFTPVTS